MTAAPEPEQQLLLASARLFLGAGEAEEVVASLRRPVNWPRLSRRAEQEGLSGLLALQLTRLSREHGLTLPLARFTDALRRIFVTNGVLLAELAALREVLSRRGAQAIVLKGAALIQTIYRSHSGVRPLGDVDLLLRASDLPAVRDWLLARGYHPLASSPTFFNNGSASFDLHTDVTGAERIRRIELAFRLDASVLWRNATPLDPADPTLLVLSPADQALHLAIHALRHSFSGAMWLVDLDLVLRGVAWDDLERRAHATGTIRALAYTLSVLRRLLHTEVPADVRARCPSLNAAERVFLERVVNRQTAAPIGELVTAFSIPDLGGKLAYLREFAFPRREVLAEIFPSTPPWLLYPRRALQVAAVGWSGGKNVLGRSKRLTA
jgi:hypothetical protein